MTQTALPVSNPPLASAGNRPLTVVTVVGARPQFIKSAPVSRAFQQAGITEILIHTGQHYDPAMSDVFFNELGLPQPHHNLSIGSGTHAYQTGEGLKGIETILLDTQPDLILVYGDTNATIAGALAAAKIHIPIAHIEAGLRSFNRRMPEEVNRVLTDHLSQWLFAPTEVAVKNLAAEGITQGVYPIGDVMLDAVNLFQDVALPRTDATLAQWSLTPDGFMLLTMHRAETTDQPGAVEAILNQLNRAGLPVIFPVHPRTRGLVDQVAANLPNIQVIDPVGYLEMLILEKHARCIVTDSGGVQKEAAFMQTPCITLREQTEWVETVESGWNRLAGLDATQLQQALDSVLHHSEALPHPIHHLYGSGEASANIANTLLSQGVKVS